MKLGASLARVNARDESGQVFPLVIVLALLILACGVVVFWLGSATVQATGAQTAADAAALAGEQELITELNQPKLGPNGAFESSGYDLTTVCAHAADLASANDAALTSCQVATGSGSSPDDLEVEVRNNAKLPASQLEGGGAQATAHARASDDSGAAASPTLSQGSSCVAGLLTGAPFQAHGGSDGFFPAAGTDFSSDCESRLAGDLDRLGIALHLHLVGASGAIAKAPDNADATATLEACDAAAQVDGAASLSPAQLANYDLTRPVPGKLDVIAMIGIGCTSSTTDGSSADGAGSGAGATGNANVHLVPWNGGPASAGLGLSVLGGYGSFSATANQLANACAIYQVWQGLNLTQQELRVALDVAMDESTMGTNQIVAGVSYGLFQQQPVSGWYNPDINEPPEEQEMNPALAATMFFQGVPANGVPGLESVYAQEPDAPIYQLAQDTQGSGAGESSDGLSNYGNPQTMAEAQTFYTDVTGGKCK